MLGDLDEHVQPLLDDDQPSWVTTSKEEEESKSGYWGRSDKSTSSTGSSPWDQAAARLNASLNSNGDSATAQSGSGWENPSSDSQDKDDELPKIVLLMRLGNMAAAALLIFGSVGNLTKIFSLTHMVLGGYGVCFGTLVCCLEVNFSWFRHPIASNFGFLYNPFLRLMFYVLMGMVAWTFESIVGYIASGALGLLALVNTFVLCRYPGYRLALKEVSDDQEKKLKKEGMKQVWKHGSSLPWLEV